MPRYVIIAGSKTPFKKIKVSSENKPFWRANSSKREPPREREKFTLRAKKNFSEGLYENLITKIH